MWRRTLALRVVKARLYAIPASHPCACAEAALRLKAIDYERIDLLPVAHKPYQRRRFGILTVPVLELDGERTLGSRAIVRAIDALVPDPPLMPADKEARALVARAEEWGEQVLQPIARRIAWASLARAPGALPSYASRTRPPVPAPLVRLGAPLLARAARATNGAQDANVRTDLLHVDAHLERVEDWLEDGVIGGERPNAADLQIGSSLRLLLTLGDLREHLDGRPAGPFARRWFPAYPGACPAGTLPVSWLSPLTDASLNRAAARSRLRPA
jgi:glutathione S-transferase